MRIRRDPVMPEVEIEGDAGELQELARALAAGRGGVAVAATEPAGTPGLKAIVVTTAQGEAVTVRVDDELCCLRIDGDRERLGILAENLTAVALSDDGGHLHVDHYPDHPYLADGSLSLVVVSPRGGMPGAGSGTGDGDEGFGER